MERGASTRGASHLHRMVISSMNSRRRLHSSWFRQGTVATPPSRSRPIIACCRPALSGTDDFSWFLFSCQSAQFNQNVLLGEIMSHQVDSVHRRRVHIRDKKIIALFRHSVDDFQEWILLGSLACSSGSCEQFMKWKTSCQLPRASAAHFENVVWKRKIFRQQETMNRCAAEDENSKLQYSPHCNCLQQVKSNSTSF